MNLRSRIQGRRAQRSGTVGQAAARLLLEQSGFRCIAEIATPTRVVGGKVIRCKKVSGDFYALTPAHWDKQGGVLVEVKRRDRGNLAWSDFDGHQVERLDAWARSGGTSLLALVGATTLLVPWFAVRIAGGLNGPRTSLTWALATSVAIADSRRSWA